LWSPLDPPDLSELLTKDADSHHESFFSVHQGLSGESGRSLSITSVDPSVSRNPWRFVVKGSLEPGDGGTWLRGTIGPRANVLIVGLVWLSVVALFLAADLVSILTEVVSGKGASQLSLTYAPVVIIMVSVAVIEVGTRRASAQWESVNERLMNLMKARDPAS
jgi:hypothetical protein